MDTKSAIKQPLKYSIVLGAFLTMILVLLMISTYFYNKSRSAEKLLRSDLPYTSSYIARKKFSFRNCISGIMIERRLYKKTVLDGMECSQLNGGKEVEGFKYVEILNFSNYFILIGRTDEDFNLVFDSRFDNIDKFSGQYLESTYGVKFAR